MEVEDRAAYQTLRRKYDYLTSALQHTNIVPSLFSCGLISSEQMQDIKCIMRERSPLKGCERMLDILMSNGSKGAFQKFLDVLQNQSNLEHLVLELQSEFHI